MPRAVPKWIGRTADSPVPPRVKAEIYLLAEGRCVHCTRFVDGSALKAEYDHIIPLIIGGENRQINLQLLCEPCHAAKTKLDVKLKAKVARVRKRHLGIKKPSRFACARTGKFKQKIGGGIVLR